MQPRSPLVGGRPLGYASHDHITRRVKEGAILGGHRARTDLAWLRPAPVGNIETVAFASAEGLCYTVFVTAEWLRNKEVSRWLAQQLKYPGM